MKNTFDHATGYFFACIARRLRFKVIGMTMKDNRPAYDFPSREPVTQHSIPCSPLPGPKERRQITGVLRMGTIFGVIMRAGIFKGIFPIACAGRSLMNMQGKYRLFTSLFACGQASYIRQYNRMAVIEGIKQNLSSYAGIFRRSPHLSPGIWAVSGDKTNKIQAVILCIIQNKSPPSFIL